MRDDRRDARRGFAVAVGECRPRHRGVGERIGEQAPGFGDDGLSRRSDQPQVAARDAFGPLGLVAQDEQRNAECGRFLLHAAGVAEDEIGAAHAIDQRAMAARLEQGDVGDSAERLPHGRGDKGVGRQNYFDRRHAVRSQKLHGADDGRQPVAPAFAAVAGDEHAPRLADVPRGWQLGDDAQQGVDRGVAGDVDRPGYALAMEVGRGQLGRREQQVGMGVDPRAIALLWPWQARVVSSQARFDMGEPGARSERRLRPAERARGVALDDQQVGTVTQQRGHRRRDPVDMIVGVALSRAVEVDRRKSVEAVLDGIEGRVLAGQDQTWLETTRREGVHDGGKFDRFGPRADDQPDICRTQPSP